MIDLDELERKATTGPSCEWLMSVDPDTVLALVRAVRAAERAKIELTPSYPAPLALAWEMLDEALAPFREGGA